MGGYCALALARRAPERVVGIVLAGSKAGADDMRRRVYRTEPIARLREKGVPGSALVGDLLIEEGNQIGFGRRVPGSRGSPYDPS